MTEIYAEIKQQIIEAEIIGSITHFDQSDIAGDVNLNGFKAINSGVPTADTDLVTKKYVDDLSASGIAAKIRVVNSLPLNPDEGDECFEATDNAFYIAAD